MNTMRKGLAGLFAALAVSIALLGCAAPAEAPKTNDVAAAAIQSVTAARRAATQLLLAGKITVEQDQAMQLKLDKARAGIVAAKTTADLASAIGLLREVEATTKPPETKP